MTYTGGDGITLIVGDADIDDLSDSPIKEILESETFKEALEEAIRKGMCEDETSDGEICDIFCPNIALDQAMEVLKKYLI